jgi:hypothetical protein
MQATTQFTIVFPASSDLFEGAATTALERESRSFVERANALAERASAARGEYRALLLERAERELYAATAWPSGICRGGVAPYIVRGAA